MDELRLNKETLDRQEMFYGIWSLIKHSGSIPDSREGAAACIIGNNFYLFGGFSRDLFNDMRIYHLDT